MIVYSTEAEPGRAYLLRNYNDLDVYVEDVECQNMYVRLVNRVLEAHGKRISTVFPLDGRRNLLARCTADQAARPRRRIYLMDADQDLILGRPVPLLDHFHRLGAYCSENLLLSESAVITIAAECDVNKPWHQMAIDLAFRVMIERSVRILSPLFIVYAVVYDLDLPIETVAFSVHRLLETPNDPLSLSPMRVRSRVKSLIQQIHSQVSHADYRRARSVATSGLRAGTDPSIFISGKDYLLPLIHMHLRNIAGLRDSPSGFKIRLAQLCELDPGFSQAILRASL